MSLIQRLEGELKEAMRERDADRRDALRLMLNSLRSAEKELQRPLTDQQLRVAHGPPCAGRRHGRESGQSAPLA